MNEKIRDKIISAPEKSGVYIFRSEDGEVLYVGKAKNLKNRLRSYIYGNVPYKIAKMLECASELEIITTDTELNAFILESNLIKTHKPRFNVLLKDDKHYPYIKLAINDPYPYLEIVRRPSKDGALYYGPYVPTWAVRETIKVLTQAFPIRRCKENVIRKRYKRPCLNYQIRRCVGVCGGNIDRSDYMELVEAVKAVLEGDGSRIVAELEKKMLEASEKLEFEKAARYRDQIFSIKRIMQRQKVLLENRIDADAIVSFSLHGNTAVVVLFIRSGMLIGEKGFVMDTGDDIEAKEAVLRELYMEKGIKPEAIFIDEPEKLHFWQDIIGVKIKNINELGIFDFAKMKAKELLEESLKEKSDVSALLLAVKQTLKLSRIPTRVEGYDISNIYGDNAVGSMVVFENAKPKKSEYRRFRIKSVSGIDDYSMMREVMLRRVKHSWARPDLIVIDGGKGHLNAVLDIIDELGWETDVISISKGDPDEIWLRTGKVLLDKSDAVLHFIQRVRDESHRFALSYHRRLRKKEFLNSVISSVKGIGDKRKKKILNFLSENDIFKFSCEEFAKAVGIPVNLAEEVMEKIKEVVKDEKVYR